MSDDQRDQQAIGVAAVRQVATLVAAAAITAPKSGGQLFLAGKPAFLETVIIGDPQVRADLGSWLRARGKERREAIWFRDADADVAEAVDAILFIGLAPNWYPPNYDCGACGYATCAEFLHATKQLRTESAELEFTGPTCNLRDITSASQSAPPPAPPRCTRSTAAARRASRSPPASSATSARNSPSPCRCRSRTRRSGLTAACPRSTSTALTCPPPEPCPSASMAPPAPTERATSSNPAAPPCGYDIQHAAHHDDRAGLRPVRARRRGVAASARSMASRAR
jgi:uncharacterized ferredoxin-like protein